MAIKAGTGCSEPLRPESTCDGGHPASGAGPPPDSDVCNRYYDRDAEAADPRESGERGCNSTAIAADRPEAPIGSTPLGDAQTAPNALGAKWNDSQGAWRDRGLMNAPGLKQLGECLWIITGNRRWRLLKKPRLS